MIFVFFLSSLSEDDDVNISVLQKEPGWQKEACPVDTLRWRAVEKYGSYPFKYGVFDFYTARTHMDEPHNKSRPLAFTLEELNVPL